MAHRTSVQPSQQNGGVCINNFKPFTC
jgi:hypothetical protein